MVALETCGPESSLLWMGLQGTLMTWFLPGFARISVALLWHSTPTFNYIPWQAHTCTQTHTHIHSILTPHCLLSFCTVAEVVLGFFAFVFVFFLFQPSDRWINTFNMHFTTRVDSDIFFSKQMGLASRPPILACQEAGQDRFKKIVIIK